MEPKFKIGQTVYRASYTSYDDGVTCPDCGGTGRVRVIFHDDTIASVDCGLCSVGYNPPTGRILVYKYTPVAIPTTIKGFEVSSDEIRYETHDCYRSTQEDIFDNEKDCLTRAQFLVGLINEAQESKIATKEKNTKSWAWNASYHRREIKELQRRTDYHTRKLNVASLKVKEISNAD